jgi:feruloyl-CoA synthase
VPRAFDILVRALRADSALRRNFFSRLQLMFHAGSALPQNLWEDLIALPVQETGKRVPMVTAWGSTETAPLATDCHFQAPRSGVIGLPAPGVELKLLPAGGQLEIRVRGPNVAPGYLGQPELTVRAFDEEGYCRIGDAARFADRSKPEAGLVFDGRVAEDVKLSSVTWVNVGAVRIKGIELLSPVAQDIVVTGHDAGQIVFMVFAYLPAGRRAGDRRAVASGRARQGAAGAADDAPAWRRQFNPGYRCAADERAGVGVRRRDHRQGLYRPVRRAGAARADAQRAGAGRGQGGRHRWLSPR